MSLTTSVCDAVVLRGHGWKLTRGNILSESYIDGTARSQEDVDVALLRKAPSRNHQTSVARILDAGGGKGWGALSLITKLSSLSGTSLSYLVWKWHSSAFLMQHVTVTARLKTGGLSILVGYTLGCTFTRCTYCVKNGLVQRQSVIAADRTCCLTGGREDTSLAQ